MINLHFNDKQLIRFSQTLEIRTADGHIALLLWFHLCSS